MAVGDRYPDDSYVTGYENGCERRSDGHLYNKSGYQIETNQEKRERLMREACDATPADNGPTVGDIIEQGFDNMGHEIENTLHNNSGSFVKGVATAAITGAVVAGAVTAASELKKNPYDTSNAAKKGLRNALCVLGILAIIAVVLVVSFVFFMLSSAESPVGMIIVSVINILGLCVIIGLIRVMMNKTFFPSLKRDSGTYIYTKRLPIWSYILIEIGSIIVLGQYIQKAIEDYVTTRDPDLAFAKNWNAEQYYETGLKIFISSIGIAAVLGIIICIIVSRLYGKKKVPIPR